MRVIVQQVPTPFPDARVSFQSQQGGPEEEIVKKVLVGHDRNSFSVPCNPHSGQEVKEPSSQE